MRMSREAKAEHHAEIVAIGSRILRERGISGTSVADIMQAAGFAHGGFYRHFASKEALIAEASEQAYGELLSRLEMVLQSGGPRSAVEAYVTDYLSETHVAEPEIGCPMVALGSEIAREHASLQQVFANGTQGLIEKLSAAQTGVPAEQRAKALTLLINLVGTVVMARAVGSGELRAEILSAGRSAGQLE